MPRTPHIVLLMADHLRCDCLSCYGDLGVRMPHLNALAQESVVFDHAYCSTPLCVPTRTSLATGKWPHSNGVIVNGGSYEPERPFRTLGPQHRTYYEQLADGGYDITHVGVQHVHSVPELKNRVPRARFFLREAYDENLKRKGFVHPEPTAADRRPVPEHMNGRPVAKMYPLPSFIRKTAFDAEDFLDEVWSRQMSAEIAAADPSRPNAWIFQCWAPHPPYFVPEPYFSMYDPAKIRIPESVGQWYPGQPAHLLYGTGAYGSHMTADDWRPVWAAYFGLSTMVDDCIGRVITALKDKGVWDDALVIMTVDHGDCLGAHSFFQKFVMYEESAHVPLLIKPPRGATGRRRQMVGHVDIAATLCDYAGVPPPPGNQGASLRSAVENPDAPWRDATFSEFHGDHGRAYPSRAIFTERWKYIYHFFGVEELYDIVSDPLEKNSLADSPAHQPIKTDLRARLARWMRDTGDILDMDRDKDFTPLRWREFGTDRVWRNGRA